MPFIKALSEHPDGVELLGIRPGLFQNWWPLTNALMGDPDSELSVGEQELIGAYTAAVRGCTHCYSAHYPIAIAYGIDPEVFEKLIHNFDEAPLDDKMRPILEYIHKLVKEPHKLMQRDADAIFAAGWSERTLTDTVLICCLFMFMTTLMIGHGADETDMSDLGPMVTLFRAKTVYGEDGATFEEPEALIQKSIERFGEEATNRAIARAQELNFFEKMPQFNQAAE
ncbi:MAG: carboxymuconolactone decarboxylase family protein [Pseudomonadota bacterium]